MWFRTCNGFALGATGACLLFSTSCGSQRAAPAAEPAAPVATKVEHFFATSAHAEELFHFFRDTLELPQVWPYQTFGGFASGGITLGNVVFELVKFAPAEGDVLATEFAGIALEPVGTTDALLLELKQRGIPHAPPDSTTFRTDSGFEVGWVNTVVPGILPEGIMFFFCDYLARDQVTEGRRSASEALAAKGGGPLGVLAVHEIVVTTGGSNKAFEVLRSVAGPPARDHANVFPFASGPALRLQDAGARAVEEVIVQVQSLDRARQFLGRRGMLGASTAASVTIAPAAIKGLQIRLVE